ncbi:acyltransferase [Novosphingobium umbonatum]|uniref:Acyltransferase n=1 Tax=Novosphingobium umbonatum TaxID=1908524 RepID=A0A437N2X5_9SPHN|nr:acyltransferase [Novosphingobium umbonatum]RVU04238.1 acyltransferase [Novosphingobium umbonatum]
MRSAKPAQFAALTGLRGLAAWLVVLFHTRLALGPLLPPWAMLAAGKGYLAVDLFFILSGFVIWHSYADSLQAEARRGQILGAALRFWWRRLARIWPLHGVMLAACAGLALLLLATGRPAPRYPWAELPLHLLLMQNWGFTAELSWNDPAWSISCEMAATWLFPLLVLVPWGRLPRWALGLIGLMLLALLWAYFYVETGGMLGRDVTRTGLLRCLLEFWLGNGLRIVWGLGLGSGWLPALAALTLPMASITLGWEEAAFVPATMAALILCLAREQVWLPLRWLGADVLHWLGEISYATYLSHFLIFVLFKLAFVHSMAGGEPRISWCQWVAYLMLVLAASHILHRAIEKPAQRWLNRLI